MNPDPWKPARPGFRQNLYEIIFEADSFAGKLFDVILLLAIVSSVFVVMFETVESINNVYGRELRTAEWGLTILFTLEYFARIYCCEKPASYVRSFFGIIDLLATFPTYIFYFFSGAGYLIVFRSVRLLRVFRVLKMTRYLGEAEVLVDALSASRRKITVFIFSVVAIVLCVGALMHVIEGPESGFTSIPISMYWAIVTLTTVGYGDIAPQTVAGQTLASIVMICGYGIIAVPTGIVTAELSKAGAEGGSRCPRCGVRETDADASFCRRCGSRLGSVANTSEANPISSSDSNSE